MKEAGGFTTVGELGPRYVFNGHFYDQKALSGVFMWGKAKDGQYTQDFGTVRERAAALGTAPFVSEFGSPLSGSTSDKTPTVLKGMYQALDSSVTGAEWWRSAAHSGPVLSSTQWQWDIYNGRHHEPMNGNPDKIQTDADAWNGEDFSVVDQDAAGEPRLRMDARVLDRAYPAAVAGHTLAFTYEDRSAGLTWNPIPTSLPNLATVTGAAQYAVLVWRSTGTDAATELQLPASFAAATVLSDVAGAVRDQRLIVAAPPGVHYAFVTNAPAAPDAVRAAAQAELARWVAAAGWPAH
jgi:hypothetical protein